jgi:hypothetical protein
MSGETFVTSETGARRPRRRTTFWVALAAGVLVVLVASAFGARVLISRLQASRQLDQATSLMERADATVVSADKIVRSPIEPDLAQRAESVRGSLPRARQDLEDAIVLLEDSMADMGRKERERAAALLKAAQARAEMLDQAAVLVDFDIEAATALPSALSGWDRALSAAHLSDQAVSSYNKLTREGVVESRGLNARAKAEFTAARADFSAAEGAFPEAPFERYVAYVDERLGLVELSRQADEAWLGNDSAEANRLTKKYNARDKEAVSTAKALPATPQIAIIGSYETATKAAVDAFFAAREAALEADRALKAIENR